MTKILVAEDELDIRDLLVDLLCDAGYEVVEAADGGAALEQVCREQPDIILLDVMMPVLDGFQVLENLKDSPATRSIPVIMVTARGQDQDKLRARAGGAWGYITKPWNPNEVQTKVKAAETAIR